MPQVSVTEEGEAGIKTQKLVAQLLDRDRLNPSNERQNNRIILQIQSGEDFGHDLRIRERRGGASTFISETFDLSKVVTMVILPF